MSAPAGRDAEHLAFVGVRFHCGGSVAKLRRALASLGGQSYRPLLACVAIQGDDAAIVAEVGAATERLARVTGVAFEVDPVADPSGRDLRTHLLNRLVARARERGARYLSFLDYDDLLFSHAVATLVDAVERSGAAAAFADIHCADVVEQGDAFFVRDIRNIFNIGTRRKIDLLKGNFLPLHAYLFDLSRVAAGHPSYDESLTRLEDYDALLRFASGHSLSSMASSRLIGLYNFYSSGAGGGGNTSTNVFFGRAASPDEAWRANLWAMLRKNGNIKFDSFLADEFVLPPGMA
jgi:hypothetical protein